MPDTSTIPRLEAVKFSFGEIHWKSNVMHWFILGYDKETFIEKYINNDPVLLQHIRHLGMCVRIIEDE